MAQKVETHKLTSSRLFNVGGWVCLVTGGGTGIGLMATQALVANGAKVYITSRRMDILKDSAKTHQPSKESGGQIIPIGPCDVTKKEDLDRIYKEIEAKESQLDLLVLCSGVSGSKAEPTSSDAKEMKKTLWENEEFAAWDDTYRTDVSAVYFSTIAFLPLLQAASKTRGHMTASVIVISSMSGLIRHAQGHFSYNAAKGATIQLTKLMSGEFAKLAIRVNSIAPGYFPSEMTAKESDENQKSHLPDEKVQEKGHVPTERAGSDEEMAMAILFLAKNTYVQGQILLVDGGVMNELAS